MESSDFVDEKARDRILETILLSRARNQNKPKRLPKMEEPSVERMVKSRAKALLKRDLGLEKKHSSLYTAITEDYIEAASVTERIDSNLRTMNIALLIMVIVRFSPTKLTDLKIKRHVEDMLRVTDDDFWFDRAFSNAKRFLVKEKYLEEEKENGKKRYSFASEGKKNEDVLFELYLNIYND